MSKERSEIGANIRNYIELNKALEIDGVGKLIKNSKPSSLNRQSHFLHPGHSEITLSEGSGTSTPGFIGFLSDKLSVKTEKAEVLFQQFRTNLLIDLMQDGKSTVFDLGQFFNKDGRLQFKESTSIKHDYFYGLPALPLNRIASSQTVRKDLPTTTKIEREKSDDSSDRNFLFKVAAIAACFVLCIFAYHNYSFNQKDAVTSLEIDQSRLNKAPEKVLVSEEVEPELIPGAIEKEKDVASCALIIGSFAKKSNAVELQSKVLEAGFALYTEEFHEFYRVGVSLDCADIKGASFLEVEQALGVDPWLRIVR